MIEQIVAGIVRKIRGFKDFPVVIESQNGVHPMDKTFMMYSIVDQYNLGTSTKTLTTRDTYLVDVDVNGQTVQALDGVWEMNQPKAYVLRVGIHGRKQPQIDPVLKEPIEGDKLGEYIEMLQLMLDTTRVRELFMDAGYTIVIDEQVQNLTHQLNTDQYVVYSFRLTLKTNIAFQAEQSVLTGVELDGRISNPEGIREYKEVVEMPD